MSGEAESRIVRNCRRFSKAVGALAIIVGCLALLGWLLGVPALTSIFPGLATMKPNTALCFVLAGVSLCLIQSQSDHMSDAASRWNRVARILSGAIALMGLLALAEYLFHLNLGLDDVLFHHALLATGGLHPGRMSGATALGFLLLGSSLLFMSDHWPYVAQRLALLTSLNGFVACVGYLLDARALYDVPAFTSMALHTAILFAVLGLAVLAVQPRMGLMAPVTSGYTGGVMSRRTLPLVVVVPILFGWLRWRGQLAGLYGTQFGIALLILIEVITFAGGLWMSAVWLNRLDEKRHEAERDRFRMAAIVESSEDAIFSKDLSGRIISWNQGAERLYGYAAAEIIGQPIATIIPPELQQEARQFLVDIAAGRLVTPEETVRRRKDGSLVNVSLIISPVRDFEGNIVGASTIAHDISERMRAEEALRESQHRLTGIIASAMDAIVTVNEQQRIVLFNSAAEKMFRCTEAEALGQPIERFIPERYRSRHSAHIRQFGETGVTNRAMGALGALWAVRADGEEFQIEASISQIDSRGKQLFTVILRDVTERKESEEALRESERQFRTLGDSIPQLTWMANADGWIVWYNQRWYQYTGTTFEQMQGWGWQSVHDPADLPKVMERWQISISNGDPFDMVFPLRGADGVLRPFLTLVMPVRDADGRIVRWFGTNTDISDQKRTEDALRKSEERFSKAFRNSPLAITIATEEEGRYLDVNDAFLNMVGRERAEVIGYTGMDIGIWAQESERAEMLRQLAETGRVSEFRKQHKTKAGEIRETEVSADLIELEGQRCVLAIVRDITETQRLEAQFRQAQKMEAVGRLAGGVAHDFNNMLGVIIGYSDLAHGVIEPESPANRHMEQIKKASQRAVGLTRQLLAFSRQQVVFPKILDLNEVVQNVTTMLQRLVGEDVAMSFHPTPSLGSIQADPGQIEQILMNLVVNARDAMPSGGEIIIETGHAELDDHYVSMHPGAHIGEHVVLAVSDTGCGMDETTKSKIFEPFFTTKGVGQGTGLGLSTVYGIVDQSGGTIFVYSEPDKGTTFKIYFPRVTGDAEHVPQLAAKDELPGGSEAILVVEDDEYLRELSVSMLQGAGYQVIEANNAEEALGIVKASDREIDLLLTDVIMPEKVGLS